MKFTIKHETKRRMRIHVAGPHMSYAQADTLLYYLQNQDQITFAKVMNARQMQSLNMPVNAQSLL